MGEGILLILPPDSSWIDVSLGGSSKDLITLFLAGELPFAVYRGFPGASSHRKGMETGGLSGGVSMVMAVSGGSLVVLYGSLKKSLGVEFGRRS